MQDMVKELVELEVEEEEDPFKGMNNAQITEIYHRMKPEDRRLFRQFKSFHKLYFELHGHDVPSHHLARGIVHEIFGGLPAADTDIIANTRAELLAAERLKDLCKQLGLAVPVELQYYKTPEAPEYPPPPSSLCFPSRQQKEKAAKKQEKQPPTAEGVAEADVKPDMKPPRTLATTYLGQRGLLRILGASDEDHIIMKVVPGTDPLQEYDEDDPSQLIMIDYKTDESSNADDLSSVGGISRDKF